MTDEIQMFVPVAIRAIIDVLASRMNSVSAAPVRQIIDLNPMIYSRISCGETFDIGITNPTFVASLAERGFIDRASQRPFGSVALALARRKESIARPVLRDCASIKTLLREARTVAYVGAGSSGANYLAVLDRLRLAGSVGARNLSMERGQGIPAILAGEVELLAAPLTTVMAHPGLEPAAILHEALDAHIPLEIFVRAKPQADALRLLEFLMSADLDEQFASAGLRRPGALD